MHTHNLSVGSLHFAPADKPGTAAAPVAAAKPAPVSPGPDATPRVRFQPASYAGKPDAAGKIAQPYVADATILGLFPTALPLQIAGFTLQLRTDRTITVHMPWTSKSTFAAKPAIQPATRLVDDASRAALEAAGVDFAGEAMPVAGARAALDKLHDAIRDAWAKANSNGQTRWNVDIPLSF
jgi:hypothetical protein